MQYQLSSDNLELSKSMTVLAKKKFSRIEARLKKIPEHEKSVRIVMNKASGVEEKFEVKAEVKFLKNEYFSDESDYSLESALIGVVNEITRMMERDKEKWETWEKDIREIKRSGEILAEDLGEGVLDDIGE